MWLRVLRKPIYKAQQSATIASHKKAAIHSTTLVLKCVVVVANICNYPPIGKLFSMGQEKSIFTFLGGCRRRRCAAHTSDDDPAR